MNTLQLLFKSGVALGAILGLVTFSSPATAAPVNVQSLATAGNAAAGESGISIGSSALIDVLVTDANGSPVTNLGSTVGDGTFAVTLPTGWTLDIITNPPGGCLVTLTQFSNKRDGGLLHPNRTVCE